MTWINQTDDDQDWDAQDKATAVYSQRSDGLRGGYWNDDGEWVDDNFWDDTEDWIDG